MVLIFSHLGHRDRHLFVSHYARWLGHMERAGDMGYIFFLACGGGGERKEGRGGGGERKEGGTWWWWRKKEGRVEVDGKRKE